MEEKDDLLLQTLLGGIKQLHYSPNKVDDGFSKEVFDLYMERLDNGKRWLTASEVSTLSAYQMEIDDAILEPDYEFFEKSIELKKAGLARAKSYYQEILKTPFDFTKAEDVELDGDKKGFAANENELKAVSYTHLTLPTIYSV